MRAARYIVELVLVAVSVALLVSVIARGDDGRGVLTLPALIACLEGPDRVYEINPEDAHCSSVNLDGDWGNPPDDIWWTVDLRDYATLQNNCPGIMLGRCH